MTKAKLVILRHGQTEHNKQSLLSGQQDVPLTAAGEEQAREAGALISPIHFSKVYSSNLSRAFNTAALAIKSAKTQPHLLNQDGSWQIEQRPEIAEMDFGTFSGRSKDDPEVLNFKWNHDTPLPGGESLKQVVARVQKFFDSEVMPRLKRGENVLIVAHSGILRAFEIVLGVEKATSQVDPGRKRSIPNAVPVVYEYENGALTGFFFLDNPKKPDAANQNIPPVKDKKQGPKL